MTIRSGYVDPTAIGAVVIMSPQTRKYINNCFLAQRLHYIVTKLVIYNFKLPRD